MRARWGQFASRSALPSPPFSLFPTHRFPLPQTTLADLIHAKAANRYVDSNGVNAQAVQHKVYQIVSRIMGVAVNELHPAHPRQQRPGA